MQIVDEVEVEVEVEVGVGRGLINTKAEHQQQVRN